MMKNTFVLQMITSLEILDTTQPSKKHHANNMLRKFSLCKKREISEKINNVEKTFAVSDRDKSEALFRISTAVAFNTSIYINECLEKQLLPFIHKYHGELTIYCGQI